MTEDKENWQVQDHEPDEHGTAIVNGLAGTAEHMVAWIPDHGNPELSQTRAKQIVGLRAGCAAIQTELAAIQTGLNGLVSLLMWILPEVAVCPVCGPYVRFDEDGCCGMCGADVSYVEAIAALSTMRKGFKPWMCGSNEVGTFTVWEGEADPDAEFGWTAGRVVVVVPNADEAERIIYLHGRVPLS